MPRLSIRVSDEDLARLAELRDAHGLGPRGTSQLVRALIAEAHGQRDERHEPVADEREVHELLTQSARGGSVPAMHELRMLLKDPPGEAGGRGEDPKPTKSEFDRLDQDELAPRRAKPRRRRRG